jgi:enediyne biosynthesis protein E4
MGIDFVHEAPTFDARLEHIMPQVASTGASVSVVDFDRDGWLDLYVTDSREGSLNRLYRNRGDGTFEDVAAEVGLADVNRRGTGVSMARSGATTTTTATTICSWSSTAARAVSQRGGSSGSCRWARRPACRPGSMRTPRLWLDFDNDGWLDLFIAGYWSENVDLWNLETTRIMPESFEYANNGGRKYLLRNRGDGTFEDVTEAIGIDSRRWTLAVTAADMNGTGYPDLFLANDYGVSELYATRRANASSTCAASRRGIARRRAA